MGRVGNGVAEEDWHGDLNPGMAAMQGEDHVALERRREPRGFGRVGTLGRSTDTGTRSAHTLNCFAESELQGPGVAGETTAVVQVGGDGGLGREVTGGGWRNQAAHEGCTYSEADGVCKHSWVSNRREVQLPALVHTTQYLIVFPSETPVNLWDFSVLIIWERWDCNKTDPGRGW